MKTIIKIIATTIITILLASCGGMQMSVGPVATIGWNGSGGGHQEMIYTEYQQTGPRYTVGEFVSNDCFGNQPVRPTPGCVKIRWEDAFGPQGPWINDFGRGRAQVQRIPVGQIVLFDQQNKWAWKEACGNRVMMAVQPSQPRPQQIMRPYCPPPMVQQQRYCPPPMMQQPYCPPPQPRLMFVPYPQQRQQCPPGYQRRW